MAFCALPDVNGHLVISAVTPEACSGQGGYVVLTSTEFTSWLSSNWFQPLSANEAGSLAAAILGLFALAWTFREIVRFLRNR